MGVKGPPSFLGSCAIEDTDFPPAPLLGLSILDNDNVPAVLGELLVPIIRRLPELRQSPLFARVPLEALRSGYQAGCAGLPTVSGRLDPRLLEDFAVHVERFEETIHQFLLRGQLTVRGCPAGRPKEYQKISKWHWLELRPTLRFQQVVNRASQGKFDLPMIDAVGPTSEYHFLKLLPPDWTAKLTGGLEKATAWMKDNVTSPESFKRDDAVEKCCDETGCSYSVAREAWERRPKAIRRKSGRPMKIR